MDVQMRHVYRACVWLLLFSYVTLTSCYINEKTADGENDLLESFSQQFQLMQQMSKKMDVILTNIPSFESRLESMEKKIDGEISKVTEKLNTVVNSLSEIQLSVENKIHEEISGMTEKFNSISSTQEDMALRTRDSTKQFLDDKFEEVLKELSVNANNFNSTFNMLIHINELNCNTSRSNEASTELSINEGFENMNFVSTQVLRILHAITKRLISEGDHLRSIKEDIIAQYLSPLQNTISLVHDKLDKGLGNTVQRLDGISTSANQRFEEIIQQTAHITTQMTEADETHGKMLEMVLQALHDLTSTKDIPHMISNLNDDHTNIYRALDIAQNKSETRLDLMDRDISSKLNVILHNTTQIEDVIQSLQDLRNSSFVLHNQTLEAIKMHDKGLSSIKEDPKHEDCSGIYLAGNKSSGIYEIYPKSWLGKRKVKVYCDMTTSGGGWTVIQRRNANFKPRTDFYRNWCEYKSGFGKLDEEFWLGLEYMNIITSSDRFKLRIDLADFDSQRRFAEYSSFSVGDEESKFMLSVTGYNGDAGDSMTYHDGMKFTTKDENNDPDSGNCASHWTSAWWFKYCYQANLNGPPNERNLAKSFIGIIWMEWRGGSYSLKETEMKIRPAAFQ